MAATRQMLSLTVRYSLRFASNLPQICQAFKHAIIVCDLPCVAYNSTCVACNSSCVVFQVYLIVCGVSPGRVTTVVATAVTNQGPSATEVPSRAARGRSRVAATRGSARGPALRGRPTRTGGMSVATAVVTATEGEEAATMDTAAVTSSAAGAAPTITRNRYEFDLPWTPEEEHRLLEGYKLHTKPAEQAIDSAKSLT